MKVYCKTCRHIGAANTEDCWHPDHLVKWTTETWYDYKTGLTFGNCKEINKNNDCTGYKKDKIRPTIWTIMLIGVFLFSLWLVLTAFGVI